MSKFKVNEIAIVAQSTNTPLGVECEIIKIGGKTLRGIEGDYTIIVPGIPSRAPDGSWVAMESWLRKKPQPREDTMTWEELNDSIPGLNWKREEKADV